LTYDAFISYSHRADERLAPSLQTALGRFAKSWHQRRALRVFRDDSSLPVTSALWAAIRGALDESRYLVVLASPEAAASEWVNKEIEHWVRTKPLDHVLPVLTDGEWIWDDDRGDFDWRHSTAVPPALKGVFSEEPRHLDLRWAGNGAVLDLGNLRFREAVAELAAPIHGRSKDELEGEDVRQYRRFRQARFGAVAGLVVLMLAAVLTGLLATTNARRATSAAAEARRQQLAALSQQQRAEQSAAEAKRQAGIAATQQQRAKTAAAEARRQEAVARTEQQHAEQAAAEASQQQRNAETQRRRAEAAAAEARRQEAAAKTQQQRAEQAAAEARKQQQRAEAQRRRAEQAAAEARKQERIAAEQARVARSLRIAGKAIAASHQQLDQSLLLSMEAVRISPSAEARGALFSGLEQEPRLTTFLRDRGVAASRLAASPTGRTVAVMYADGAVVLWDVPGRRQVGRVDVGQRQYARDMVFSHDGGTLAISYGREVLLWDVRRHVSRSFQHPELEAYELAFTADDRRLVVADSAGVVRIWDLRRGEPVDSPFDCHGGIEVQAVAISPDGTMFAVQQFEDEPTSVVVLCDMASRQHWNLPWTLAQDGDVRSLAFSPDGQTLAVGGLGTVTMWDVPTHEQRHALRVKRGTVYTDVAFSSDSQRLATVTDDKTIEVWAVQNPDAPVSSYDDAPIAELAANRRTPILSATFMPDGTLVSGDGSGALAVWDLQRQRRLGRPLPTPTGTSTVAASPDGKTLVLVDDGEIVLWDAVLRRRLGPPLGRTDGSPSEASGGFSPDGTLAALAHPDGSVALWNVRPQQQRFRSGATSHLVTGLAFSRDGRTLAVRQRGGAVLLLETGRGRQVGQLVPQATDDPQGSDPSFSPDGSLLAAGYAKGTVVLWDVPHRRRLGTLGAAAPGRVFSVAFSPKGRRLVAVVGEDGDSESGDVVLWDLTSHRVAGRILGDHEFGGRQYAAVAFTLDAGTLVAGTTTGTIGLWDTSSLHQLGETTAQTRFGGAAVSALTFSRDGGALVASSGSEAVRWAMSMAGWRQAACSVANRNLTRTEWNALISSTEAYRRTCPSLPIPPG
jgi:WD40 repeat protein